ncbi:AraC family transcriptional regulator [Treponema denticola]|uniref:helix-turn-helix transcriptional regulator n=1 Tax=Treponema denticola TaxID=158 RepID=UPI0021F845F1|nr:AraC family transcriptional regulator [Treponema denticola]UYT08261.1 AraC family transcriptional regulator [Treponema denticola]
MKEKTKNDTIIIKLYEGIHLEIYDTYTEKSYSLKGEPRNVFRIDYCFQGLLEGKFENQTFSYLGEKETAINYEKVALSKSFFPLKFYKGISILFFLDKINSNFKNTAQLFNIDVEKICKNLDLQDGWYKIKINSEISYIMNTLYEKQSLKHIEYFQIKLFEILYLLSVINTEEYRKEEFYSGYHINKVKKIHEYAVNNIDKNISFKKMVKNEDLSYTIFQKLFKQIYGESPYSYLKKYRLKIAAFYISSTDRKITDIAINCGYLNASKFSDAFKSVYGISPIQYRNGEKPTITK